MKVGGKHGIHATERTNRQLAEYMEEYVYNHASSLYFESLINDLLEFRVEKTTKFDAAMAFGYALMADKNTLFERKEIKVSISDIFKKHQIQGRY
jgi:ribosomal protein S3AE